MVHGGPQTGTRLELAGVLAGRCYAAGNLVVAAQEGRGDHDDSHRGQQPVVWWRRRVGGGDMKVMANPSEDSLLGARRSDVEWHNAMRWGIARWRCLL
jgi:hypothetical protein